MKSEKILNKLAEETTKLTKVPTTDDLYDS